MSKCEIQNFITRAVNKSRKVEKLGVCVSCYVYVKKWIYTLFVCIFTHFYVFEKAPASLNTKNSVAVFVQTTLNLCLCVTELDLWKSDLLNYSFHLMPFILLWDMQIVILHFAEFFYFSLRLSCGCHFKLHGLESQAPGWSPYSWKDMVIEDASFYLVVKPFIRACLLRHLVYLLYNNFLF